MSGERSRQPEGWRTNAGRRPIACCTNCTPHRLPGVSGQPPCRSAAAAPPSGPVTTRLLLRCWQPAARAPWPSGCTSAAAAATGRAPAALSCLGARSTPARSRTRCAGRGWGGVVLGPAMAPPSPPMCARHRSRRRRRWHAASRRGAALDRAAAAACCSLYCDPCSPAGQGLLCRVQHAGARQGRGAEGVAKGAF